MRGREGADSENLVAVQQVPATGQQGGRIACGLLTRKEIDHVRQDADASLFDLMPDEKRRFSYHARDLRPPQC